MLRVFCSPRGVALYFLPRDLDSAHGRGAGDGIQVEGAAWDLRHPRAFLPTRVGPAGGGSCGAGRLERRLVALGAAVPPADRVETERGAELVIVSVENLLHLRGPDYLDVRGDVAVSVADLLTGDPPLVGAHLPLPEPRVLLVEVPAEHAEVVTDLRAQVVLLAILAQSKGLGLRAVRFERRAVAP